MKNLKYWENRKAREAFAMYENIERSAEELAGIYAESSAALEEKARRLFRRFGGKYGITEQKAKELLLKAGTTEMDAIVQMLARTSETAEVANDIRRNILAMNRIAALQKGVDDTCGAILSKAGPMFRGVLSTAARDAFYKEMYMMQQYADAAFFFNPIAPETIEAIMNTNWSGENYSKRIWQNTEALAQSVKREIVKAFLTGESPQEMSRNIRKQFASGAMESRRLMRTESNYCANQATRLSYIETGVDKYIYVAILDLKTSQVCRELDKQQFFVKDAAPGENYPPMHPWCRSTTIAWMPDELLKKLKQSAIDPNTGERITVPADMTYQQWYDKYVLPKEKPKTTNDIPNMLPGGMTPEEAYAKAHPAEPDNGQPFEKGEPMSFEDADGSKVNPNFSTGDDKYWENCQSCVPTYEARRRGYDIEALPRGSSAMQSEIARDRTLTWIDPKTGKHPVFEHSHCKNAASMEKYIKENVVPGERYLLGIRRRNSGHIVCVEHINGSPAIYDPQSGVIEHNIKRWLQMEQVIYRRYGFDDSPVLGNMSQLEFAPGVLGKIAKAKK